MSLATIDVRELVGRPGSSRQEPLRGTLEGLETELAEPRGRVEGSLLLESLDEGILVSGRIRGSFSLRCARCLTAFERPFEVEVHELFSGDAPDDGDEYPLGADASLDPDQMVRDAVGVEMPFSPLCRPDCLGLCETCGGDRNAGECPGHDRTDPRWDALTAVLDALEG